MIPARFTETTRQHGLYRKGVGLGAVQDLAALAQTPVPVIPPTSWHERSKKPTTITHMGALIRAGLAARDGDHYRATPEGQSWLGKLVEHNIFTPQTRLQS